MIRVKVRRSASPKLQRLISTLSRTDEVFLRMRQEGAIEARAQVRRSFAEGRDPYGNAWAPLKLRSGGPLRDGGDLAEFDVRLTPTGFVLTSGPHPAPQTHQYGALILPKKPGGWLTFRVDDQWFRLRQAVIPKRQMVPEKTWGDIWERAFEERFNRIVTEWMAEAA
jgi:hypothetical protein